MIWLVSAIVTTVLSIGVTGVVLLANMMSDAPTMEFQDGWVIAVVWGVTACLYVVWWFRPWRRR